ncbi:hypothetical protein GWK47_019362 [Chionoecetes opilio]|uniref:Uncharacterized protein n=1 Tax=Chionoecetes opilio TaxID=41210 RepID=A0A8J4XZ03_CHIOP|nr:hypothetical protein GWK47_019362 [Chionoecetes opilio]
MPWSWCRVYPWLRSLVKPHRGATSPGSSVATQTRRVCTVTSTGFYFVFERTNSVKLVLEESTELVDMCADVRRHPILEALYIKEINPKLNVQANDLQALPSMKRTKANNSLLTEKPSEDQTTNQRHPLKKTRSKSYLPITDAANRLRGRQTGYK